MAAAPLCAGYLVSTHVGAAAVQPVQIVVDPNVGNTPISSLIYGINGNAEIGIPSSHSGGMTDVLHRTRATLVRLGGNRWTAFNWENNASNAGFDYLYQNDSYLSSSSVAGAAVDSTVAAAQAAGAATNLTVPIGDYVAADTGPGGDVRNTPDYLNTRFKQNRASGGPLSTTPNTADGFVYQNQFAYRMRNVHPAADLYFQLDNEPNDWATTHAEIFGANFTYQELVDRNLEYASAIKAAVPSARVSGPSLDGWQGQEDAVNSDGSSADYQAHGRFLDFYLQRMHAADELAGHRIVDTLDLHWYPQVTPGLFNTGHSPAQVAAREQAPRSLWDPTYVEDSWITQSNGGVPIRLLPRVQQEIATHNPGMGLAISEWNYGGGQDISGGIATADTLGIFGREGVSAATLWPQFSPDEEWTYGAFALFRNYDGAGSAFGDVGVHVSNSDTANTSAYAAKDSTNPDRVTIVAINKNNTATPTTIQLSGRADQSAVVYTLTSGSSIPQLAAPLAATSPGAFAYAMPAQSVSMIIPSAAQSHPPQASAPSAVRSLRASYSKSKAKVTWLTPLNNGGLPITRFEYRIRPNTHSWGAWKSTRTSRSVTISRKRATKYQIQVRAINQRGAGKLTTLTLRKYR